MLIPNQLDIVIQNKKPNKQCIRVNSCEELIDLVNKELKEMKLHTMQLCEEEVRETNKVYPKKNVNVSKSMANLRDISSKTKQLIKTTNSKIKQMKEATNNIMQLNSLYLTKNAKKCYYTSKQNNQFLPQINQSKENKYHNFVFVADNYRKQLNKAFMRFNPVIHLENLKLLQEADPIIKEDIVRLRKSIANDMTEITNKHYYANKYSEYMMKKKPQMHLINQKSRNQKRMSTGTTNSKEKSFLFKQWKRHNSIDHKALVKKTNSYLNCMQSSLKLIEETVIQSNILQDNLEMTINNYIKLKKGIEPNTINYFNKIEESMKEIQKSKCSFAKDEDTIKYYGIKRNKENNNYLANISIIKNFVIKELKQVKKTA